MQPEHPGSRLPRRSVLVVSVATVVHSAIGAGAVAGAQSRKRDAAKTGGPAQPKTVGGALPPPVIDMLELMRAAISSGEIEDLRAALQWNELPPTIADGPVDDPIAHWKRISSDGAGREILAVLSLLLDGAPALVPLGPDIENNRVYVWPAIAERPMKELAPAEQVQLLRLVPAADAQRMRESGRYDGWRLMIGRDGTWHSFLKRSASSAQ